MRGVVTVRTVPLERLCPGDRFFQPHQPDVVYVLDSLEYPMFAGRPDTSRGAAAHFHSLGGVRRTWTAAMEVVPLATSPGSESTEGNTP
jgi:hypothetical protein